MMKVERKSNINMDEKMQNEIFDSRKFLRILPLALGLALAVSPLRAQTPTGATYLHLNTNFPMHSQYIDFGSSSSVPGRQLWGTWTPPYKKEISQYYSGYHAPGNVRFTDIFIKTSSGNNSHTCWEISFTQAPGLPAADWTIWAGLWIGGSSTTGSGGPDWENTYFELISDDAQGVFPRARIWVTEGTSWPTFRVSAYSASLGNHAAAFMRLQKLPLYETSCKTNSSYSTLQTQVHPWFENQVVKRGP